MLVSGLCLSIFKEGSRLHYVIKVLSGNWPKSPAIEVEHWMSLDNTDCNIKEYWFSTVTSRSELLNLKMLSRLSMSGKNYKDWSGLNMQNTQTKVLAVTVILILEPGIMVCHIVCNFSLYRWLYHIHSSTPLSTSMLTNIRTPTQC